MGGVPRLIGMIHLGPLPGSPAFEGHIEAVVDAATRDATVLADAGFGGVMIENLGDAPYFADDVPDVTVAAMTRATMAVRQVIELPVGVNVLRNDVGAAIAIAAAAGASFVRVNVLNGVMYTDQGPLVGRAAEVMRLREAIAPGITVMADVFVKHAVPPAGLTIEDATRDLAGRGGADVVVVSGAATGHTPDLERIQRVRAAAGSTPVYVGSGATIHNVSTLLAHADGCIVGTSIKQGGVTTDPVDPGLAARFVSAAG